MAACVERLTIVNTAVADQEDALEGLTWLLLNRWVIRQQAPAERAVRLGAVPDWLAVGVAQNLYPELRSRNNRLVGSRWMKGATMDMFELLTSEFLPPGRWIEKAEAGVAMAWMMDHLGGPERMSLLFDKWALSEDVDLEWISKEWLGFSSRREMAKSWDLWLACQQQAITATAEGVERLTQLREMLFVNLEDYSLVGPGLPDRVTFSDMIKLRSKPWVPLLAERLSLRIQALSLGQPADFQQVTSAYGEFLEMLKKSSGHKGGLFGGRFVVPRLAKELNGADDKLRELESDWTEQRRFMDQVAADLDGVTQAGENPTWRSTGDLDDKRIKNYLDEVEKQQSPR